MLITDVISICLVLAGFFFFTTATLGLLRFPDFFARLHATGKGDTLAVLLSLTGLAVYHGFSLTSVKIVFIAVFMFLAQPTATHAISRAAFRCGEEIWTCELEMEDGTVGQGGGK
ncbi:MAG: monovalent cation/H(+) antiporter subunit G [Desulfobacteraceae bacterium]|jgi:multicomponent Na+:H+ antiporter subunit G